MSRTADPRLVTRIALRNYKSIVRTYVVREEIQSDSHPNRTPRFSIQDMTEFCERISDYTAGYERAAFIEDSLVYDATIRNLELIGDATAQVSQWVRDRSPDVPWQEIVGLRSRIVHGYESVGNDNIWWLVRDAVPKLPPVLRGLMHATSEDSP